MNLVSAHGRTCDPVAECMQGRPTFFLTGGSEDPATLCAQLAAEGFGDVQAVVGQCLGTPEESSSAAASKSWPQAASTA